jgi:DNA-directed RNA polymerase subunit RPC12/RpoP
MTTEYLQGIQECAQCGAKYPEDVMKEQFDEWRCPECYEDDCRLCGKIAEACQCHLLPSGDGDDD